MDRTLKLPVGIDNFEKIRKSGFYYIDKNEAYRAAPAKLGRSKSFLPVRVVSVRLLI